MFAAIDWNEVLMKALGGAVLGGIGGACAGLVAYLTRKSEPQTQSEWEARERARIHPKAGTAKTMPGWFVLLAILAIIVGVLVVNPSLVAPATSPRRP